MNRKLIKIWYGFWNASIIKSNKTINYDVKLIVTRGNTFKLENLFKLDNSGPSEVS